MSPVPRYPRSDRGGYNSGYRGAPRGGGRGRGRGSHNSGGYESGPPVAPTYDSYETNGYNGGERYNSTPSTFGSYGGPPPPAPGGYVAPTPYSGSNYDDDWNEGALSSV